MYVHVYMKCEGTYTHVCTYQSQEDVMPSSVTSHVILWLGSLTESEARRFG